MNEYKGESLCPRKKEIMPNLSRSFHRNKPLWIIGITIVSIVAVVAIALGVYALSPSGKASYQAVEVPESSQELTEVPEAPIGRLDEPDDPYIGVDMLGQPVATVDDTDTEVDGETGESGNSEVSAQNSNGSPGDPGAPGAVGGNPGGGGESGNEANTRTVYGNIQERTQAMNQVSNIGTRFKIDSVGLDVPLGALTMVDNVVEPTNFSSVFQIRNLGVPYTNTTEGTTYLATHALDVQPEGNLLSYTPGGLAPGNFFFNTADGESTLNQGDEIVVGDRTFAVTGHERIGKGVISQDQELWDSSIPNRLVILLCQPDSNDNHVVYATPVS